MPPEMTSPSLTEPRSRSSQFRLIPAAGSAASNVLPIPGHVRLFRFEQGPYLEIEDPENLGFIMQSQFDLGKRELAAQVA